MTLERQLATLREAADAARSIGLDVAAHDADEVARRVQERIGFAGATYVLALAGGTGVGKSSVLNALAGQTVSAVRAVRPTTEDPVAWVAEDRRDELAPLLAWIGVRHHAGHADASLAPVAILDLPDVDSVRTEHRATVDELLPRIDAIAWVVDPEKYDDERLHAYLRELAPHASRLRFILNKTDRVAAGDRDALVADLRSRLAASGITDAPIHAVSAATGEGVAELRIAIAREADAKAVVVGKLETDVREAHERLARAVGIDPRDGYLPLLADDRRAAASEEAIDGALAIVDPSGVARQTAAAVLGRARRTGGSFIGRILALLAWLTGQQRRSADPAAYLRDWRRRGTLGRVLNPVRAALVEASTRLPAGTRPALLATLGAEDVEPNVVQALDRVTREAGTDLRIPGSILWPVIGALQLIAGAAFAFAAAWYVTLFLSQGNVPVAAFDVPLLGPVPMPLLLLAGSVAVSALLGLVVSIQARWIGKRAGRRLEHRVREAVGSAVAGAGFGRLDRVEEGRRAIASGLSVE